MVHAQERVTSSSEGAYSQITDELYSSEKAYFDVFYRDFTDHGRGVLERINARLYQGQRGSFGMLLAYADREAANDMLALFDSLSDAEFEYATDELRARDYRKWLAIIALLEVESIENVRNEFLPDFNKQCWVEEPDDVVGNDGFDPDRPAGAKTCTAPVAQFKRDYVRTVHRVIRGSTAQSGEARWQAQFLLHGPSSIAQTSRRALKTQREWFGRTLDRWEREHTCGAVYIGEEFLLTAAHCIGPISATKFFAGRRVRVGTQRIDKETALEEIGAVITHRSYNSRTFRNDIALIRLKRVPRQASLERAKLPPLEGYRPMAGSPLLLTGWGFSWPTKDLSRPGAIGRTHQVPAMARLQKGVVRQMRNSSCNAAAGELCAGTRTGVGSCRGDSGGPLVDTRTRTLIGIVSHAIGCGQPDHPTTFVDVAYYLDWIADAKALARRSPNGTKTTL